MRESYLSGFRCRWSAVVASTPTVQWCHIRPVRSTAHWYAIYKCSVYFGIEFQYAG